MTGPPGRRATRRVGIVLVLLVVLIAGGLLAVREIDRRGWAFFNHGRDAVEMLAELAAAVAARDAEAIAALYADDYRGRPLGLTDLELVDERDGVSVQRFRSADDVLDRDAAVAEWMAYLGGFQSIEEVGAHVHRLLDWGPRSVELAVRYELIGTPSGASRPAIDRAWFQMRLVSGADGRLAISEAGLTTEPPEKDHELGGERISSAAPQFVDVAAEAGVAFSNRYYPPFLSQDLAFGMIRHGPGGITAADVDNDGWHDLFVPDGVASRLFRNNGDGTFSDITEASGLGGLAGVSVGIFADFDNDGHKDFFVSRTFEPNLLFHNNGDATFTDVTEQAGIGADCCTTVASVADYDRDGLLDLYVGRYLDPRERIPTTFYARNGEPNQLYRNNGDGTFTNTTEIAGVGETGLCLGSVFGDYDDDGDADLYVANDFGRKTLYRNDGPSPAAAGEYTFTDVTAETGTLAYGAGMSASFGDYDNDGLLDLYVAHIRSEHGWFAEWPTVMRYMLNTWRQGVWKSDMPLYWEIFRQSGTDFVQVFQDMASGNTLLRNLGDGTFEDVTWEARANPLGWFWGSGFYDFDNDGWLDIYSTNGWVYNDPGTEIEMSFLNNVVSNMREYKTGLYFDPDYFGNQSWHGWERNRHLRNEGDGTFREIGRAAGTDLLANSRGLAVADFWNRGVLDMAVAASDDIHALLQNRVGGTRHWLAVEVRGRGVPGASNADGVGARVTIRVGEGLQTREVVLGDGYGSQSSLRAQFGLGEHPRVDSLEVRWPVTGEVQLWENVAADRIVEVLEGRAELVEKRYAAPAPAGRGEVE